MQAIVLLRLAEDPLSIESDLVKLRCDPSFIRSTHAIIEHVLVGFGAAHFILLIHAASMEQVYSALRYIRTAIRQKFTKDGSSQPDTSGANIMTSTVVGWEPSETDFAKVCAIAFCELKRRISALPVAAPKEAETEQIMGRLALESYVIDRLKRLCDVLDGAQDSADKLVELKNLLRQWMQDSGWDKL